MRLPQILTIEWWRWCFAHGNGLAKQRLKVYYRRHIRRQLRRPICWVKGHNSYDNSSWGYSAKCCSRCNKTLFYRKYGVRKKVSI